jgi:hypothetical protein
MGEIEDQPRVRSRWALVLRSGVGQTLTRRANEPMWVTDAFLVDPASADGRGAAVDAGVTMGNRHIRLASLSAERPWAELQTLVMLDESFSFFVMPRGGDPDTDDEVVVQFEGFLLALSSPEREHEGGGQDAVSSADGGGNRADDKYADEEGNVVSEERRRGVKPRLTRTWQRRGAASRLTRCS